MENPLNKNIIKFNVAGAIDYTQTLTFEIHNERVNGAEEISITDMSHEFYQLLPVLGHYLEWQIRTVAIDHHWNVNPKKVWVKCVRFFHHSHDWFSFEGDKNYDKKHNTRLSFKEAIDELKGEHTHYEIYIPIGYDFKIHVEELTRYFGDKEIIVHGKKPDEFFKKKEKEKV